MNEILGKALEVAKKTGATVSKTVIDPIAVKISEFDDNAKYDNLKSSMRAVSDFVTNYPRYYIQGLIGSFKNK